MDLSPAAQSGGLPDGRVVAADTGVWRKLEKPLYDPDTGLTGRPDYVVERDGVWVPVEVKSGWAPSEPHEGHLFQLAAYCLLVEHAYGVRPPVGILHYRNRTFEIDYNPALEAELMVLLEELRVQSRKGEATARMLNRAAACAVVSGLYVPKNYDPAQGIVPGCSSALSCWRDAAWGRRCLLKPPLRPA